MKHLGLLLIPVLVVGLATSGLAIPVFPGGSASTYVIEGNELWQSTEISIPGSSRVIITTSGAVAYQSGSGPLKWYGPDWGGFPGNSELLEPSLSGWVPIAGIGPELTKSEGPNGGFDATFELGRWTVYDYYAGNDKVAESYLYLAVNDSLYVGNAEKHASGYEYNLGQYFAYIMVLAVSPTGPTGPPGPTPKMGEFPGERMALGPTTITYKVERSGHIKIEIYDTNEELVRVLEDSDMNAGEYEITWDGKDNAGVPLPWGPYFYRINLDGERRFQKVIFLR